jgi:hypothetical protein
MARKGTRTRSKQSRPASAPSDAPDASPTSGAPGSERARDEKRRGGPRYGGGPWEVADERGDRRFGHARNDDADPSELAAHEADADDNASTSAADPERADADAEAEVAPEASEASSEIESSGQRAGMRRGDKPRKLKSEEP